MKVIYIAGPFRGKTAWDIEQNIRVAEKVGFEVAELGAVPLIPHANSRFFHGTLTDEFWLAATMELLKRCDAAAICPGWIHSSGTRAEIEWCRDHGRPVFFKREDLETWLHSESK